MGSDPATTVAKGAHVNAVAGVPEDARKGLYRHQGVGRDSGLTLGGGSLTLAAHDVLGVAAAVGLVVRFMWWVRFTFGVGHGIALVGEKGPRDWLSMRWLSCTHGGGSERRTVPPYIILT